MRKIKKFSVVALGLALLITISVFLPAGAAVTTSSKAEVKSQELVFCETDTSGVIEKVRVIDMMSIKEQSGGGSITVKETNEFAGDKPSKVTGVNSFVKPSLEGDYIVWNDLGTDTNSNTIVDTQFSKSMVEEAKSRIPLDVTYKYFFNGQLVSDPKDIAGKTGHFRLEATFENTSAEKVPVKYKDPDTGETVVTKTDVYLPLVIQPYDWKFDNQYFFNLEVDPTSVMVAQPDVYQPGWSIPLFPPATDKKASIWLEADVKDFRMPALTLVLAFVFPETNQKDVLEQLAPGIKQLYGGIKELDTGLNTAVAGLGSAATPDTLIYGISQIYDGLLTLSSNTEGLGAAKAGLDNQAIPGVNQMIPGVDQLYGGTDLLIGGLGELKAKIGTVDEPYTLEWVVNQVMLGLSTGNPADPGVKEALEQVIEGLNDPFVSMTNTGLIGALQYIRKQIGPATTSGTLLYSLNGLITVFTQSIDKTAMPPYGSLYYYIGHADQNFGDGLGMGTAIPFVEQTRLKGQIGMSGVAGQLSAKLPLIQALYDGLGDGTDPDTIIGGLFQVSAVLKYLVNSIGDTVTPETLVNVLTQIIMSLDLVKAGIGDAANQSSLIGGVTQIKYGLSSGSNANPGVKEGLIQVSGGLEQLSGGLGTAIAGLGSASTPDTLLYGANLVKEGMGTMQEGLTQATAEGTQVMLTGLNGSITTINLTQGELEAIKERGAEFNSFLGQPTDGESELRFIYQTPATYKYADSKTSGYIALILSLVVAIALVLLGLFAFRKLA